MTSLAADVARLRQVLRRQTGPAVVVGHSYGGQIMTAVAASGVAASVQLVARRAQCDKRSSRESVLALARVR